MIRPNIVNPNMIIIAHNSNYIYRRIRSINEHLSMKWEFSYDYFLREFGQNNVSTIILINHSLKNANIIKDLDNTLKDVDRIYLSEADNTTIELYSHGLELPLNENMDNFNIRHYKLDVNPLSLLSYNPVYLTKKAECGMFCICGKAVEITL